MPQHGSRRNGLARKLPASEKTPGWAKEWLWAETPKDLQQCRSWFLQFQWWAQQVCWWHVAWWLDLWWSLQLLCPWQNPRLLVSWRRFPGPKSCHCTWLLVETADAIKDVPIKLGDLQALKITMREGASTMMVDSVAAAGRKISKDGFLWKNVAGRLHALRVEIEIAESGHLRPLAATRLELAGAATCRSGHLRPLAGSGHLRPLAATRWELSGAATCGHSLGAATCGHLRPLAWSSHLQPLAATRVAASGCEWLRAGRNTWQSWHLEKNRFCWKGVFFSSLEVGYVGFYRASRNHVANHMPPMSSIAWGRSWGVASTVVER